MPSPWLSMLMIRFGHVESLCCWLQIVPIQEKNSSGSTSRSMATISLGFIVMVTPWTIQEIVTACTGSKVSYWPHSLFFFFICCFFVNFLLQLFHTIKSHKGQKTFLKSTFFSDSDFINGFKECIKIEFTEKQTKKKIF